MISQPLPGGGVPPSKLPATPLPFDRYPRPKTPEEHRATDALPLSVCQIVRDGEYFLILHAGVLLNAEHDDVRSRGYDYLRQALDILAPGRTEDTDNWNLTKLPKWKTVGRLATFRQGLRENRAQGMGFDEPAPGVSLKALNAWLAEARIHDTKHHGHATF
jgi:hypothetical protein